MAPVQHKLLYAVVARGPCVLAEATGVANAGNAHLIAVRILEKLNPAEDVKVSYSQEQHMFHCMTIEGLTFMVVAEEQFGRRIPFAFLEDIRGRFMSAYGEEYREAVAYEFNGAFSKVISERLLFYATDPAADSINRVKGEMLEVKNIMIENIEKVLERGEKLDLLVDKTEVLQEGALTFRREARRVRQTMWWRNVRLWVALGGALAALLYVVAAISCGITLGHCSQ